VARIIPQPRELLHYVARVHEMPHSSDVHDITMRAPPCLINAETVHVGTGPNFSDLPTYPALNASAEHFWITELM